MKKIVLLLVGILLFSGLTVDAYVLNCPGVTYYNTYQEITFSDCVNSSYWEVGPDYFILSDMNVTLEYLSSYFCDFNLSFFNDTFENHTDNYRFFEFNATYTYTSNADIILDMPYSNYFIDIYVDNVLLLNNIEDTGGDYNFEYAFDGSSHRFCFYIDGYLPGCPTGGASVYDVNSHTVNLTWTGSSYADTYVVVRNNGSYPSSPSDGNIVQNSSNIFYNATLTSNAFFTVWTYNNSGIFSSDSCKLDIPWGALRIQGVYNESNPAQPVSPFGLLISNSGGGSTYQQNTCTAPHIIDIQDIPYGDNTVILINGTEYKSRTYYKDLSTNHYYNYSFYLPPFETEVDPGGGDPGGEGDNYTTTQNYVIQVINELNNPVVDAKIIVRRYINTTDSYSEIASLLTDGYGQTDVALIPGVLYKFNISADGYKDLTGQNWEPKYIVFTDDRYKTFQIQYTDPVYENETVYGEIIIFNGHTDGNTAYVNYSDSLLETINTTIIIYETNLSTGLTTTFYTDTRSGDNDFQISFSINRSNTYVAILFLNHTTFGYIGGDYHTIHSGWWDDALEDSGKLETLLTTLIGPNPFTWTAIIGLGFLLVFLFAFGQRNVGISILMTGFIMIALSAFFGLAFLNTSICIVIMILGILVQWRMNRRLGEG